jgi:hypothetical protein
MPGRNGLLGPLLFALAACGGAEQAPTVAPEPAGSLSELVAVRVDGDVSQPDPGAAFWSRATPGVVKLMAQPIVTPRPEVLTTEDLVVSAVHDGTSLAVRLRWKDTEQSEAGRLGEYSDAVALEFPLYGDKPLPPVMMGAPGQPVHIFHWRAQYQRDAERGKPEITELYPQVSVDMYPMDFKDAQGGSKEEREMFNPAVALGNPQSFHKSGVDEVVAEGFSTSAVQTGHGSAGKGVWAEGFWTVVITRPLVVEGGSALVPGNNNALAFAVWQGGQGEVGSRKSLTMAWTPLQVAP